MTYENTVALINDALQGLARSGLIEGPLSISETTSLLGENSILDSIAFVTFITDVEDRICRKTGKDIYLVLNEIHGFNPEQANLSVTTLAKFIAELVARQS